MALTKINYVSGKTVITAENLNDIQDAVLDLESKDGVGMGITGATVGQIAKITAVDESGKPTAWAPVDMPNGGSSVAITDDDVTAERAYAAAATPKVIGGNTVTPSGNTLKFVAAQDGVLTVENASLISYAYVNLALAQANGQPLYIVSNR